MHFNEALTPSKLEKKIMKHKSVKAIFHRINFHFVTDLFYFCDFFSLFIFTESVLKNCTLLLILFFLFVIQCNCRIFRLFNYASSTSHYLKSYILLIVLTYTRRKKLKNLILMIDLSRCEIYANTRSLVLMHFLGEIFFPSPNLALKLNFFFINGYLSKDLEIFKSCKW